MNLMLLTKNNRLLRLRLFPLAESSFIDTHIYLFMQIEGGRKNKRLQGRQDRRIIMVRKERRSRRGSWNNIWGQAMRDWGVYTEWHWQSVRDFPKWKGGRIGEMKRVNGGTMKRTVNIGETLRFRWCFRSKSEYFSSFFQSACTQLLCLPRLFCTRLCFSLLCFLLTTSLGYFGPFMVKLVKGSNFQDAINCAGVHFIHPPGYLTWALWHFCPQHKFSVLVGQCQCCGNCKCFYSVRTTQLLSWRLIENHCRTEALNGNKATVNGG